MWTSEASRGGVVGGQLVEDPEPGRPGGPRAAHHRDPGHLRPQPRHVSSQQQRGVDPEGEEGKERRI